MVGGPVLDFTTWWTDVAGHSGHHLDWRWFMSAIARYVVDAVVLEHRRPSELARSNSSTSTLVRWDARTAWRKSFGSSSQTFRWAPFSRWSSGIQPPRRICPRWRGCLGSRSGRSIQPRMDAKSSLWRERNEREAHFQLHLGPGRPGARHAAVRGSQRRCYGTSGRGRALHDRGCAPRDEAWHRRHRGGRISEAVRPPQSVRRQQRQGLALRRL